MDIKASDTLNGLEKSLEDTFEGIAFAQIFNRNVVNQAPTEEGSELKSYIDLPAPINMRFFIMMKLDHVHECFESVYTGIDVSAVENAMLADFVNELTNTAAGHFHTIMAPEKEDMTIGLPVTPDDEESKTCLTPSDTTNVVFFQVEDYEFYCSLTSL